jgi:hypothetical protein
MKINNKTILITGVILLGALGSLTGYQEALIASISGLVGYLAKDIISDTNDTQEK